MCLFMVSPFRKFYQDGTASVITWLCFVKKEIYLFSATLDFPYHNRLHMEDLNIFLLLNEPPQKSFKSEKNNLYLLENLLRLSLPVLRLIIYLVTAKKDLESWSQLSKLPFSLSLFLSLSLSCTLLIWDNCFWRFSAFKYFFNIMCHKILLHSILSYRHRYSYCSVKERMLKSCLSICCLN